jgi:hypothetical protein
VLLSRSSLLLFSISWVEVLTVLQGLNFALWLAAAKLQWGWFSVWLQFPLMVYVGLLGGACS